MKGCTATLECGEELFFESSVFVPDVGDTMPCRRHGYCSVIASTTPTRAYASRPERQTALSPERAEKLIAYLDEHPGATRLEIIAGTGLTYAAITRAETEGAVRVEVGHRRTRRYYLPA